ncbi:MAG: DUF1735 domain-containing protein [Bacteroidales bacterium]|nr:DUF1735 domain-containing protein [Bacteroidales bacterium]
MKNTFKYLLLLCASAFGFASCQEEVADVQGVVGDFAYIVDGTEAMYKSTTCYVYHTTTLGEVGEVATQVTVALTEKQASAVDIVVDVDNTSLTGDYNAFPEGVLKFNGKVTIPAGQKEATIDVKIDKADFPKLTEVLYQAPFRIASASGVKISTNSNIAYLMVVTENVDPVANILSLTPDVTTVEVKNYLDSTIITGEVIEKTITVNGVDPAFQSFDVALTVDRDKYVKAYNEAHGTDYLPLPNDVNVTITEPITMGKDAKTTTAKVTVDNVLWDSVNKVSLVPGETPYLIPIVLGANENEATVDLAQNVTYILLDVKFINASADFFSALNVSDYRLANWQVFDTDLNLAGGFTFVVHAFIEEKTYASCLARFANGSESWNVRMQYGQNGPGSTSLRVMVGPNALRKYLWADAIELNTWVQYAVVYNPSARSEHYQMYLEGKKVDSITLTADEIATMSANPFTFEMMEFGSSWAWEPNGNEFHGRIMHVGVFNRALSSSWLTRYCYRTEWNAALISNGGNGLQAYWPMNEGYGHILYEATGRHEDIDFTDGWRYINDWDSKMSNVDVSDYVQWSADAYNKFD